MSKIAAPEKTLAERQEREYADGNSDTTQVENKLPENAPVDANGMSFFFLPRWGSISSLHLRIIGCPTFVGMSGNKLIWAFTAVSSCGFTLFGFVVPSLSWPTIAILILRPSDTIRESCRVWSLHLNSVGQTSGLRDIVPALHTYWELNSISRNFPCVRSSVQQSRSSSGVSFAGLLCSYIRNRMVSLLVLTLKRRAETDKKFTTIQSWWRHLCLRIWGLLWTKEDDSDRSLFSDTWSPYPGNCIQGSLGGCSIHFRSVQNQAKILPLSLYWRAFANPGRIVTGM